MKIPTLRFWLVLLLTACATSGIHVTVMFLGIGLDSSAHHVSADAQESVYWCPMRGKPCGETDYQVAGTCEDCGMALIPKAKYLEVAALRKAQAKTVGVVLFNGFEVLDVYGPVEMLGYVKEFEILTIAEVAGPVRSTQGLETVATYDFEDAPKVDILLVPGGVGSRKEVNNEAMLTYIRKASEEAELITSVCSGSAMLAAAGVLDGHRATSNKLFFDFAKSQSDKVDWVERARWVDDGRVITSSGVSAGTDMALHLIRRLYGEERAQRIAAGAEYIWNDNADNDPFARTSE